RSPQISARPGSIAVELECRKVPEIDDSCATRVPCEIVALLDQTARAVVGDPLDADAVDVDFVAALEIGMVFPHGDGIDIDRTAGAFGLLLPSKCVFRKCLLRSRSVLETVEFVGNDPVLF